MNVIHIESSVVILIVPHQRPYIITSMERKNNNSKKIMYICKPNKDIHFYKKQQK